MIEIYCKDHFYTYNLYHLTKAFFPEEEIRQKVDAEQEPLVKLMLQDGSCFSVMEADFPAGRQEQKQRVTRQVYEYLSCRTGVSLAWGMLTGVRPTKLAMQKKENKIHDKDIIEFLKKEYYVSDEKAKLAVEIAGREQELLSRLDQQNGFSLYVGIPFCPSICSYCSFSSSPADRWQDRMEDYLDALCRELQGIREIAEGKTLNTIYIGGGTPTTLREDQLQKLLATIDRLFPREALLEYTVEAGRPDSITREKLQILQAFPVTRISINPQTMQQRTLERIGRKHTVQEVYDSFQTARELGFDHINMDLIAGLPGENACDVRDTLRQVEVLAPDSLTVHSLAIKRAARMNHEEHTGGLHGEIAQMIKEAADSAGRMGHVPYYLYRQKNIAGNFENVGYAKVDKAGIYNILIMEEKQTILAAGAGAATKILLPHKICLENGKETNLLRMENVKDIEQYIRRIEEMTERKQELWRLAENSR